MALGACSLLLTEFVQGASTLAAYSTRVQKVLQFFPASVVNMTNSALPDAFQQKMAAKGCSAAAMGAFARNYELLASNAATMVRNETRNPEAQSSFLSEAQVTSMSCRLVVGRTPSSLRCETELVAVGLDRSRRARSTQ